jgi:ribonuclease E
MPKEMLINVAEGEECRIAVVDDGRVDELYMERTSAASHVGNIYKGRVTNVEASIQAAFIDFGVGRNGFLHVSDLLPTYFGGKGNEDVEEYVGKKMARRDRPPIQRCLRRGDEIVVQVIKEGIGTKGPTLSSYLSISGKMLVMMPGVAGRGVSKKIEDEDERRRLKRILVDLNPPQDCGFILRTEAVDKDHDDIERDLTYLARLWEQIKERRDAGPGPAELYTEGDLVTRTVRDVFSSDVERVVVDNPEVARRVRDVIRISSPAGKNRVEVYDDPIPLFTRYEIEHEIEQMYSRHVPLPSGGSLVIDSTEAVVTIDVNSGKMREHNDAEMTAFKTDMEAAEEIPRQLKLRDLGGVIIVDFIDLRYERHRRELEERLFENFKMDRAKTKVLRMSQFGIIEITRQRMRPSLKRSIYFDCPHCKGAGLVKTPESMSLDLMRRLAIACHDARVARAELHVCADVAFHMLNKKRAALAELEAKSGKRVVILIDAKLGLDESRFELFDARDGFVVLEEIGMTVPERGHVSQLGVKPLGHTSQARGGRGGGRGGRLPPKVRMEPARALESEGDEAELDEEDRQAIARGEADVEERERSQGFDTDAEYDRRQPSAAREADRTDMPAILETEAGDEAADELADEDMGEGQSADAGRRPPMERQQPVARHAPQPPMGRGEPQPAGNGEPGQGGGRRRRRRRRGRGQGGGQGGQGNPQQQGTGGPIVNPDDPRGTSYEFQGGPGRPADHGDGRDNRARYAGDLAGRVADEYADDYSDEADEANGNVAHPREPGPFQGTSNRVEPADAIGPAVEGGDSIAEGEINGLPANGPAGEGTDGPRRRRRRRGGRRHRRRDGEPATGNGPSDGPNASDAEPASADLTGGADDDSDVGGVVVLNDADAIPVGTSTVEAEVAEIEVDEATVEIAAERSEPEEESPAPKKGRRTAAKKVVAKKVPVAKKVAAKKVAATAPKRPTRRKPPAVGEEAVATPAGVVATGSVDTHLADGETGDETIDPPPLPRPRSYSDLDAIPDDYD